MLDLQLHRLVEHFPFKKRLMKTTFSHNIKGCYSIWHIILWIVLVASVHIEAQPVRQWDKTFGGPDDDVLAVTLPMSDGGYLLAGTSYSWSGGDKTQPNNTKDKYYFDYGDFWLVKMGKDGNKQWDKTFGTFGDDKLVTALLTSDGGYILAGTARAGLNGDKTALGWMWMLKIDANGNKLWDKAYGGNSTLGAIIPTADGGYLLGGSTASGIGGDKTQPSRGENDYWVIKIDANGTKQWDKTFGGSRYEQLLSLSASADGGYLLGGNSTSGVSGDKTEPSRDGSSNFDYWVVKIDASGNKQWDKTFGGSREEFFVTHTNTPDGGYLLGGSTFSGVSGDKTQPSRGDLDYWVVKISQDGTKLWDKTLGGNLYETFSAVITTPDGGCILGGTSTSYIGGDKTDPGKSSQDVSDFWLVKLSADGTKLWDKSYGGRENDLLTTIIRTSDGGYLLGGESDSRVGADKNQPSQGGSGDYWILKLNECTLPAKCVSFKIEKIKTAR